MEGGRRDSEADRHIYGCRCSHGVLHLPPPHSPSTTDMASPFNFVLGCDARVQFILAKAYIIKHQCVRWQLHWRPCGGQKTNLSRQCVPVGSAPNCLAVFGWDANGVGGMVGGRGGGDSEADRHMWMQVFSWCSSLFPITG